MSAKRVCSWKVNELVRKMRTKARLGARTFRQRAGVDRFETFPPCPFATRIDLLAAIVCEVGLDLCHVDAEQAFVQSGLNKDFYMRLPRGCGSMSGNVIKLCRSLYGLKQASREWHRHLLHDMMGLRFQQCEADACVLCLIEEGAVSIVETVHVDGTFAMGSPVCSHQQPGGIAVVRRLPIFSRLECRNVDDITAGIAAGIVAKFGVTRGTSIPMPVDLNLHRFDRYQPDVDEPFRSLAGHLMWIANQTRPDILNAIRAVGKVLCSSKGIALASSVARHDVHQIYEHLRHYVQERPEMWSQVGVVRGCRLCGRDK